MGWLQAPDYWLTRLVLERALAAVYFIAFLVALKQFRPLLGENGLLPAPRFLRQVSFLQSPSLFHLRYSDRLLLAVAGTGAGLSLAMAAGLFELVPGWSSIVAWFWLCAL